MQVYNRIVHCIQWLNSIMFCYAQVLNTQVAIVSILSIGIIHKINIIFILKVIDMVNNIVK